MVLKYLLIVSLFALHEGADNYDFESFLNMIESNITLSQTYQTPINNEEMLRVTEYGINHFGDFDFIIVGAGSAGTLLANRLTEIKNWKILLLEAGGDENDFTDIPGMTLFLQNSPINWGYNTTSQRTCCLGMKNKSCVAPRGKIRGGCSVINVKMYVRANEWDYNKWEKEGNEGWGYKNALYYFKKTENTTIKNGDRGYHSTKGLLHVQYNEPSKFTQPYINGLQEIGISQVDYNGRSQAGTSPIQYTINGLKISSGGRAFIDPIIDRKNLNITLQAFVTKLLFSEVDAKTVVGVEFIKNGKKYHAKASKEVILSAGSYNSPQILMLSGIGPREDLEPLRIKTVQNLPVGKYFQEHPLFPGFIVRTNQKPFNESLEDAVKEYLKGHRPLTSPINTDCTSFIDVDETRSGRLLFNYNHHKSRTCTEKMLPDVQHILIVPPGFFDLLPGAYNFNDELTESIRKNYNYTTDLLIYLILLRPQSYGTVKLKSADSKDFPDIDYNMYSDPDGIDIDTMYKGVLKTFELLDTKPFRAMNATFVPAATGCGDFHKTSKSYWECALRLMSSTIYHPMGTTRMGPDPYTSVVDSDLKVHGIKNLRVSDAGIFPSMPSGNLNAAVYMVAEQTADRIKKDYRVL